MSIASSDDRQYQPAGVQPENIRFALLLCAEGVPNKAMGLVSESIPTASLSLRAMAPAERLP